MHAVLFDAKHLLHCTLPWQFGLRCVLLAYTAGQYRAAKSQDLELLHSAGFVPP